MLFEPCEEIWKSRCRLSIGHLWARFVMYIAGAASCSRFLGDGSLDSSQLSQAHVSTALGTSFELDSETHAKKACWL